MNVACFPELIRDGKKNTNVSQGLVGAKSKLISSGKFEHALMKASFSTL